jgi:hypothetical protein
VYKPGFIEWRDGTQERFIVMTHVPMLFIYGLVYSKGQKILRKEVITQIANRSFKIKVALPNGTKSKRNSGY